MWIILKSWKKCNKFTSVSIFNVHAQHINIKHTFVCYFPLTLNLKEGLWCIHRYLSILACWNTVWFVFARWSFLFSFNHTLHFLPTEHIGVFFVVQVQNNFANFSRKIVSLGLMIYNRKKCYQHKSMHTLSYILHTNIPPILQWRKNCDFFFYCYECGSVFFLSEIMDDRII